MVSNATILSFKNHLSTAITGNSYTTNILTYSNGIHKNLAVNKVLIKLMTPCQFLCIEKKESKSERFMIPNYFLISLLQDKLKLAFCFSLYARNEQHHRFLQIKCRLRLDLRFHLGEF